MTKEYSYNKDAFIVERRSSCFLGLGAGDATVWFGEKEDDGVGGVGGNRLEHLNHVRTSQRRQDG